MNKGVTTEVFGLTKPQFVIKMSELKPEQDKLSKKYRDFMKTRRSLTEDLELLSIRNNYSNDNDYEPVHYVLNIPPDTNNNDTLLTSPFVTTTAINNSNNDENNNDNDNEDTPEGVITQSDGAYSIPYATQYVNQPTDTIGGELDDDAISIETNSEIINKEMRTLTDRTNELQIINNFISQTNEDNVSVQEPTDQMLIETDNIAFNTLDSESVENKFELASPVQSNNIVNIEQQPVEANILVESVEVSYIPPTPEMYPGTLNTLNGSPWDSDQSSDHEISYMLKETVNQINNPPLMELLAKATTSNKIVSNRLSSINRMQRKSDESSCSFSLSELTENPDAVSELEDSNLGLNRAANSVYPNLDSDFSDA